MLGPNEIIQRIHASYEGAEKYGIDKTLIHEAIQGDLAAIAVLSRVLTREVTARSAAEREGHSALVRRGKNLPNSVVNDLAVAMLSMCSLHGVPVPISLCGIIQIQLGVDVGAANAPRRYFERANAAEYLARNPEATNTEVADAVGVNRSTVGRWRKDSKFEDEIELARSSIVNSTA